MFSNHSDLEKVDLIRQRLEVSYREAKEALERAGGDVVSALVLLEERKRREDSVPPAEAGRVWGQLRALVQKGNTTRIRLKKGDRTLLEFPVTVGALGVAGAIAFPALAVAGAAGMAAALASRCSLELDRPAGDEAARQQEDVD
ncbi:MAG: DUF4342 domain-containing protein [Syntrophomonadaceae bacterium]|nr:DUF4342 domain-containing protein [Syntrophomonadaceae bacterium]